MKRSKLVMTVMQPTVVNKSNVDSCEKCGLMGSENCNSCVVLNKKVDVFAMKCKRCGVEFSGTAVIDVCPSCYV